VTVVWSRITVGMHLVLCVQDLMCVCASGEKGGFVHTTIHKARASESANALEDAWRSRHAAYAHKETPPRGGPARGINYSAARSHAMEKRDGRRRRRG
jgi:hypothetical protein